MYDKSLLSEKVAKNIEELVLNKKLKSGDKLPNEIDLSLELNVSRSTIREAIKILVSKNILEVRRGKGTYIGENPGIVKDPLGVKFMNKKDLLLNLFEARLIIEPEIAAIAAERITDSNLIELEKVFNKMKEDILADRDHTENDKNFHNVIAKSTKNPIIQRIIPIITDSVIAGYNETKNIPKSGMSVLESHEKMYYALKDRDVESSRKCMKDIILYGYENIKNK